MLTTTCMQEVSYVLYPVMFLLGAFASYLATTGIAFYHDGLRTYSDQYQKQQKTKKDFITCTISLSLGLWFQMGIINSLLVGVGVVHLYYLMGDMIGVLSLKLAFPRSMSWLLGGAFSLIVFLIIQNYALHVQPLSNDFMKVFFDIFRICLCFIPIILLEKLGHTRLMYFSVIVMLVIYIQPFILYEMSKEGMALAVGMLLVLYVSIVHAKDGEGIDLSVMFQENLYKLREHTPILMLSNAILTMAVSSLCISQGIAHSVLQVNLADAFVFLLISACSYMPLIYTTTLVTGVHTSCSRILLVAGIGCAMLPITLPIRLFIAGLIGAILTIIECYGLKYILAFLTRYPYLKTVSDELRISISKGLEVACWLGCMFALESLWSGYGYSGGLFIGLCLWIFMKKIKSLSILSFAPIILLLCNLCMFIWKG